MEKNIETVSFIAAAQRLGTSAEAVAELVREGKLKQVKPGRITLESVYAYSGLNPDGNQTKKSPVRKPNVVEIKDAAALLRVSLSEIKRLVEAGELEICEGANGKRGVREAMLKMYKKKIEDREEAVNPHAKDKTETKEENKEEQCSEQKLEETKDAAGAEDTAEDTEQDTADNETGCDDEQKPDRKSDAAGGQESKETEGFDLDAVMEELFPGIRRLDGFARKAVMAAQKRFTREDMAEAVDIAYMKGRLSVYDSLQSFERRSR